MGYLCTRQELIDLSICSIPLSQKHINMKSITLPLGMVLLTIASYAQSSFNFNLLANWNPDSIPQYNDIWGYQDCNGREYAILGSRAKIHFLDLAVPTNPVEIANFTGGQSTTWRDIKTYRNRAYAVSDNTIEGLMIFDLSNLPQSVSKTYHGNSLFSNAHNIFIDEQNARLYVVGSSAGNLLIFDIGTNPDNPVLLANASLTGGYVHDVHVRNHVAYCSHLNAGMYVYDCSDAQNIITLGSATDYMGTVFNHSSWLSEDGNTLIMCDETHGAPVKVADVSNLSDINVPPSQMFSSTLLAPASTNSIAHNPFIREDLVFISYYHDGVQVYNISNPDSIYRVGYYDTNTDNTNYNGYLGCWGVYPFLSSGIIIASDINKGLFVLDMTNITLEPNLEDIEEMAEVSILNGPVFCEGDSAILFAPYQPELTYFWTKDNVALPYDANQITVNSPGSYRLEVSNGVCSAQSADTDITFKDRPDLSNMPGAEVDLCEGENFMIIAPMDMDVYLWMLDGNVLSNSNNVIQANQTGVYTLLAYKNGCGTFSEQYDVTVHVIPETTITTAEEVYCGDEQATLKTGQGATTYNWYKDGNLLQTSEDPYLVTSQNGLYTVTLSILECTETSEDFELFIPSIPENGIDVSGATLFCEGESVDLVAVAQGVSYDWRLNGQIISTQAMITASSTGVYELLVTNPSGCTAENEQFVQVISMAVPTIYYQNGVLSSSPAATYQWYLNDQAIEGATSSQFTPIQNGDYIVAVSNTMGCENFSEAITVSSVSTKTPESLRQIRLYPNPVTSLLQLEINAAILQEVNAELFHSNGQRISYTVLNQSTATFDLSDLSAGVYLLRLTSEDGAVVKKVVKE
jgi:choice-of-anchor B domain-containing protein